MRFPQITHGIQTAGAVSQAQIDERQVREMFRCDCPSFFRIQRNADNPMSLVLDELFDMQRDQRLIFND
jgi:hypothetical protein